MILLLKNHGRLCIQAGKIKEKLLQASKGALYNLEMVEYVQKIGLT